MNIVTYSDFRSNMSNYLNQVDDNFEPLIICRSKKRKNVLLSFSEYNSLIETNYLLSNPNNRRHLENSIQELKNQDFVELKIL